MNEDREERRKRDWARLRALTGAGPYRPIFPTRRAHLTETKRGDKVLIIRKLGGLGDVLMISALFPDLFEQYPDLEVTFAVPAPYLPLFDGHGTKLKVIEHQKVYGPVEGHRGPDSPYHTEGIQNWALEEFDLIEDISYPCHAWEQLMIKHRAILGETGLRWRNRMDRWSRWIGFELKNPRTIVKFTEQELANAKSRMPGGPSIVWSPIAQVPNRSYPWFREVKSKLEAEGYGVWFLHSERLGKPSLHKLSLRQYGAVVATADLALSVDSATFHWGGLFRRPTIGLFNLLQGEAHAKYYPTASTLQLCDTPCIAARYYPGPCTKFYTGPAPLSHSGQKLSECFYPESVGQILDAVKDKSKEAM